jgi:hypothetical protein
MGLRAYNYDKEMLLKDAGLIAASAAAQVASAAKVLDLGQARFEGVAIIDVTAIEIASNDEEYDIIIQGSSVSNFASNVQNLAQLNLGATEVRQGGAIDSLTGRYELPFVNEQADVTYRYIRAYVVVDGAVATGINFTAWVAPFPGR